jgi:hypothetical protein
MRRKFQRDHPNNRNTQLSLGHTFTAVDNYFTTTDFTFGNGTQS